MKRLDEKRNLEAIADSYTSLKGMDWYTNNQQFESFKQYLIGESVLELGCADGGTTTKLAAVFDKVIAVDGSKKAIDRLRTVLKDGNIQLIESLFEELVINEQFDVVLMAHILEHVADPLALIKKFLLNVKEEGVLIITVPNAKSFHRIAAVEMGLLPTEFSISPTDKKIGHRRVFDSKSLKELVEEAGLKIIHQSGYWLKFLSNSQIEAQWSEELIQTYMQLGHVCPEHAAELVIVCQK